MRQQEGKNFQKKPIMIFFALLGLPLSLLLFFSRIPSISRESYSLPLIGLFMLYMYLGTYKMSQTKRRCHPAFIIGFLGLLMAPWYSLSHISLLVVIQALYSLHFYQLSRLENILFLSGKEQWNREKFFSAICHVSTFGYLALFILQGLPVNFFYFGISAAYSLFYFKASQQKSSDHGNERNISAYLLGLFINMTFFEGLLIYAPIYEISWYLMLTIPLIWLLFWMGYWGQQRGLSSFSQSIYEVQFVTIILSFVLPLQLGNYSMDFIFMLAFGYLFSTLLFSLILDNRKYLFTSVLIGAFLYYSLIPKGQIAPGGLHVTFLLPSFVLLGSGMWLQKKNHPLTELFYFGCMVLTVFFLITLRYGSVFSLYGLSVYALLYCLAYGYARDAFRKLAVVFYWMLNALSAAAIISWLSTGNVLSGIFLGFMLSAGHFFIAYQTKRISHIYIACSALALAYYLGLSIGDSGGLMLLKVFPLALLITGCSYWAKRSFSWGEKAFKLAGHFGVAAFTLLAIMNSQSGDIVWLFLSLLIYTVGYLILSLVSPSYEYSFLAATFFSLSFYFCLQEVAGLSPSMRLQCFSVCPFLLGLTAFWIRRKKGEEYSQPVIEVAILVALISSFIPLFSGSAEASQKLLLFSAVFYIFIAIQLKEVIYIYLSICTLGLTIYNLSSLSHQRLTQDLFIYYFYLIIFLTLFFIPLPYSNYLDQSDNPGQGGIQKQEKGRNWKRIFVYSLLLGGFPCLLIPLCNQKLVTYPGFCSRCHYMEPYVEAWKHSSHGQARCVQCHYEPFYESSIQEGEGRFVSMVKSLDMAFSIFPRSRVSDQACLQEGCHSLEEVQREIVSQKGYTFKHGKHIEQSTRGRSQRCIVCHAQIVQGDQQRVDEDVCQTCHINSI
ncbi:MAG: hypothetical protein ACMUIA_02360 [bacterium]